MRRERQCTYPIPTLVHMYLSWGIIPRSNIGNWATDKVKIASHLYFHHTQRDTLQYGQRKIIQIKGKKIPKKKKSENREALFRITRHGYLQYSSSIPMSQLEQTPPGFTSQPWNRLEARQTARHCYEELHVVKLCRAGSLNTELSAIA